MHFGIPKTSPLHLFEPKETWFWLGYPSCPPRTFKCMTLHSGYLAAMPTRATLSMAEWL